MTPDPIRFTLTGDSLIVHDGLRERGLSDVEAERVRSALESPPLPWWMCLSAIALGVLAVVIGAHGWK